MTENLTLNSTIHPDFSQVEADAGQLIIDPRAALFFAEKRPFFLDGAEQFNTPSQLIYTRRIVQPVAAAKLTGKAAGTEIAFLSAVDDRAYSASGADHPVFNILRLQRGLGAASRIGLTYTDKVDGANSNRVAPYRASTYAAGRSRTTRRSASTMNGTFRYRSAWWSPYPSTNTSSISAPT